MNWLVQDAVLVRFKDDPALLHWRCVLACKGDDDVLVVTPDRDIQPTVLKVGPVYTEIMRMKHNGRLPTGVREDDTYLPKHSDRGDIEHEEMRRLVATAEKQLNSQNRRRVYGKIGLDGKAHLPTGAATPGDAATQLALMDADFSDRRRVAVYSSSGTDIGQEVFPPLDANMLTLGGKAYCAFDQSGTDFLARGSAPEVSTD